MSRAHPALPAARASCSCPGRCSRSTSSSPGTGRWWPTRSPATGRSAWRCCYPGARGGREDASADPPRRHGRARSSNPRSSHDGRYNILLEARFRFRVLDEEAPAIPTASPASRRSARFRSRSRPRRERVIAAARRPLRRRRPGARACRRCPTRSSPPERLASEIALRLRYAPPELQALLETDSLASRFEALAGRMLEWKGRCDSWRRSGRRARSAAQLRRLPSRAPGRVSACASRPLEERRLERDDSPALRRPRAS